MSTILQLVNLCTRQLEHPKSIVWKDMPSDIGHLILDKLHEVFERVRFGAVCKNWNTIAKEHQQLFTPLYKVLPMILVPSQKDTCGQSPMELAFIYTLEEYFPAIAPRLIRYYKIRQPWIVPFTYLGKYQSKFKLPFSVNKNKYIGFSHGWIAVQNKDYTITLIYPFGKKVVRFDLPKIESRVNRFIISPHSTPNDFIVVIIHECLFKLSTIKSGEKYWVKVELFLATLFDDMIFYQGEFYVISIFGVIIKIDISKRPPTAEILYPPVQKGLNQLRKSTKYFVESTSSDLYVVQRFLNHDKTTNKFKIHKLEIVKGKLINIRGKKSLNEDTFFVGNSNFWNSNSSMAIKTEGCVPNSVYFIDNISVSKEEYKTTVCYYKVEDGTKVNLFDASYRSKHQPLWIVPQYCID